MKKVLSTLLSLLMMLSLGTMNIAADEGTVIKIPVSYTVVDETNSSDVKLEGNSPVKDVKSDVDVKTIVEDLTKDDSDVKSKLTDKQITAIKEGASTNIALVVSNTDADEGDKTTVNNVIEQYSLKSALMMDVDLLCTVTRNDIQIGDTQNITETKSEISVGVKLPDEYINTDGGINREYWVVRLHYSDTGVTTDVLPATFDSATKMLTFKTNKFSLYAIAYKDTKVESEYVYIPSKNKKPVVNTAGYSFSPANIEISGNSATTVLKVDGLPESNVLDVTYNPVLELKSADNKTINANVEFVNKITEDGSYTLNVKLQDTASKPALGKYEGTITVTIEDNEYEAKIGNNYYSTLKKAIDEAENNDTVKIVKKVSLDEQLVIENKVLTLDLNGKTISENGAGVRKIRNEGILTITDSSSGGTICNTYIGEPGQDGSFGLIDNYGTLTIDNGIFVDVAHGNGSSIKNRSNATLIINDGQFINTVDDSQKQSEFNGAANALVYSDGEKVEIKGGTFTMTKAMYTPAIKIMSGTGVVDGATISTYKSGGIEVGGVVTISNTNISVSETNSYYANALAVSNDGTINVNSGSFTGYSYGVYIYSSGGTVNINDGNFEAGTAVLKADTDVYSPYGSYINVYGGEFIGRYEIASDNNTKLTIRGGTFSTDPSDFVANTAISKVNSDGTYSVHSLSRDEEGNYIIKSLDDLTLFERLVNEKNNSYSGETVKLVDDIDLQGVDWKPIGQTGATQFLGTFDGDNHTIRNLKINNTDVGGNCSTGLFGWLNNATVKNLTIDGSTVSGHHNVGVIAGYLETSGCTIDNCHVLNATISCTSVNDDANGDKCGGIVGHAGNAGVSVKDCTVTNSSISAGRDAGQVVGAALNVNVTNCSASNVTVSDNGTSTGANIRNEVIGRKLD